MASLNLDLDYFTHPKTRRLVGRLGRGAEVLPLKLWAYCGKYHARDGMLTGYSATEIEGIAEWWGKHGECIKALIDVRFMVKIEDGYQIHEWEQWQGHIWSFHIRAKNRAAKRWSGTPPNTKHGMHDALRDGMHDASDVQCSGSAVLGNAPPKPPKGGGRGSGGGPGSGRVREAERLLAERNGHATKNGGAP